MRAIWVTAAVCLLFEWGCGKTGTGQHATVQMRDGRSISGTVMSSSASEVQITGDDQVSHTIPMSQVRSIDYGEAVSGGGQAAPVGQAPTSEPPLPRYHPEAAAITTKTYELPPGTEISVRTDETIDSRTATEGQTFAAEVLRDVSDAAHDVVIPRGANAQLVIKSAAHGGKFHGASDLVIDMASVSIGGRRYHLNTTDVVEKGHEGVGVNRRTGEFAGGGAAVGAIIGAIAGGGKGAAIGAGAGAGGGALTEILTKGSIKIPAESRLTFRLEAPLRVIATQ